ncbi:MAG: 3-methyl-2-oxobutanoate hydroxymethyltransferase [Xanthomonadales bacterium]|nr:3-methyl-2-oxobutanoate hydroxymethyltransferase [Xanthomonadales bacterium]
MNVLDFQACKARHEKIVMLTCYDYTSARIVQDSDVDVILVGDSAAMVMHGYGTTIPADIEMMCRHIESVARGTKNKFIVGDMPFLSFRQSLTDNMRAVASVMKAGAHAVKLEGIEGNTETVAHIVKSGVPVMGHLGLTPQSVNQLGGYRVQGRGDKAAKALMEEALACEQAGCFALVLECVPDELAGEITASLSIPTIGIGAGAGTDGQVLVMQDLLGLSSDFKPKFVRKYLDGRKLWQEAFNSYASDVKSGQFPATDESYHQ